MKKLSLLLFAIGLQSCIIQAPKYSTVDKVFQLQLGMTQEQVTNMLGVAPYDLKSVYDNGQTILVYVYRTKERRMIPFLMNGHNGVKAKGKFVALNVYLDPSGHVTRLESCSTCDEIKDQKTKIDFNAIATFITVTAPAVLIYLGLQSNAQGQ